MIAESHSSSDLAKRKAKPNAYGSKSENYNKTEDTISMVYCDICNGVSRTDCLDKLKEGLYGHNPLKQRQAEYYYKAALDRIKCDRETELETLKDMLYARYEALFADAVECGDRSTAKSILDSLAKIFLGSDKNNTNIQVNANSDGVKISFGFSDNKDDE